MQDWLNPVVERSVKVAAVTSENIVKKVCHYIYFYLKKKCLFKIKISRILVWTQMNLTYEKQLIAWLEI